jgi:hypothetical protein
MQKDLLRYLNGEVNCVRADVIIGREKASNGDYIIITPSEIDAPLYEFWHGHKKKGGKGSKPKHTGGKPSYAKLYLEQLGKHIDDGMSIETMGACMYLAWHLEWDTNLLVVGRGEHKRLMKRADMAKLLKLSLRATSRVISELKKCGILERSGKGYKFTGLFQKGRGVGAD